MTHPHQLTFDGPIATLTMDDGRGNAINPVFLRSMERTLHEAEAARVLILRGREKLFSGGLDLPYLMPLGRAEFDDFIEYFDRVMLQLLTHPRPIITCARGGAIAGGAVLFSAGDFRLATPTTRAGINEVVLGLNFPTAAFELVRVAVGEHRLVEAATLGRIYEGNDCLQIGFATEVVAGEHLDTRARTLAEECLRVDAGAAAAIRLQIRRAAVERVRAYAAEDRATFVEQWFSAETQKRREALVARLATR